MHVSTENLNKVLEKIIYVLCRDQTDFIIRIKMAKTFPGIADVDSDHSLLVTDRRLKHVKKRAHKKMVSKAEELRF